VSDEDATIMLATCTQQVVRVGLVEFEQRDTTHGQTGSAIHRSRPPADQSGKRVASRMRKSPDTRDILVALRHDVARVGRVGEEVTRMLRENRSRGV